MTAIDACAGSRPVANAFWLPSPMMKMAGIGMFAATESSRTTSMRTASRFGSAGRAPALSRISDEPNRLPRPPRRSRRRRDDGP